MSKKIHLLVIDPQRSFCADVPAEEQQKTHDGELCISGAWDDMVRVANMVKRLGTKLDEITLTMDSHHNLHIAHGIWFRDTKGGKPDPFTIMREDKGRIIGAKFMGGNMKDVGEYTTVRPGFLKWTLSYLKELETGKRYPHCIWPVHCLIGTKGYSLVEPLAEAVFEWERDNTAFANKVTKGSNYRTEHFSALRAEVADPDDPTTQINATFLQSFNDFDEVLLAGEALSHCLCNTVKDLAGEFADDSFIKKCVLLTDASSNVPGFEKYGEDFIKEMTKRGMKTSTTKDYLA